MSSKCNISLESHYTLCAEEAVRDLGSVGAPGTDGSTRGSEAAALEMDIMNGLGNVVLPHVDSRQALPREVGNPEENGPDSHCPSFTCDTCVMLTCTFFLLSVVGLCLALVIWLFLREFSSLDN